MILVAGVGKREPPGRPTGSLGSRAGRGSQPTPEDTRVSWGARARGASMVDCFLPAIGMHWPASCCGSRTTPRCSRTCRTRRRHLQRCFSTAQPFPPSDQPPQRIAWLCSVEQLQPVGSSSSSGSNNGNGSGQPQQPQQQPHTFSRLAEADLLAPGPFDAIMVLAGGLTRDGGLPEWVHRCVCASACGAPQAA